MRIARIARRTSPALRVFLLGLLGSLAFEAEGSNFRGALLVFHSDRRMGGCRNRGLLLVGISRDAKGKPTIVGIPFFENYPRRLDCFIWVELRFMTQAGLDCSAEGTKHEPFMKTDTRTESMLSFYREHQVAPIRPDRCFWGILPEMDTKADCESLFLGVDHLWEAKHDQPGNTRGSLTFPAM